jgi:hypothetical protein
MAFDIQRRGFVQDYDQSRKRFVWDNGQTEKGMRMGTLSEEEAAIFDLVARCWMDRGIPKDEAENRALNALRGLRDNDPNGGTWCLLSVI